MTDQQQPPADPTPWMAIARAKIGQHEEPGSKNNNPFILECFLHTTYDAAQDEVPWCAAFVCWVLDQAGIKSTRNAAAASYCTWGQPAKLQPGAIVVIRHVTGSHHVCFVDKVLDSETFAGLGGNQSDSVRISNFPIARIIATRMP